MIQRIYFQLAFTFLFVQNTTAQEVIPFYGSHEGRINDFVEVYHTPDTLKGQEVWSGIQSGDIEKIKQKVNPGITSSAFWVVATVANFNEKEELYLEIDYAQLDYLHLYQISNDSAFSLFETGDKFPFEDRPVQYRNFTFPLKIQTGDTATYLLNIDKRLSAARFPMYLYSDASFWNMYNRETIFYGFCFGFLALVTLISLLVGIKLKMHIFLWYAGYVFTFGLRCFAKLGYGFQHITSNYPEFNTHFFPLTTQLAMVFLIMYIQRYFDTKMTMSRFHKLMDFWLWLFVISTVIWALFPGAIVAAGPILISMRYLIIISIIIFAYSGGINYLKIDAFRSRIFLVGYSLFFLGVLSQILIEYGAINSSLVPGDPLFAGFFFEVGVLSYAMVILLLDVVKEKNTLFISNQRLQGLVMELQEKDNEVEKAYVILKSKAVVDPHRIRYIQSDDHYLEFHLNDKKHPEVDRNKLSAILEVLPPQFVQIHRSTIVNLEYVKTIYGSYLLLNNGEELKLSRTYKPQLEERLVK